MLSKSRFRTKKELLTRKKEFLKICDILDSCKVNYFLSTGILLGAIRDNDLIKWDWDIEISVFANELLPKIDLVSKKIKKSNFKITKIDKNQNNSKINFIGSYPEEVTSYTIEAWKYSIIRGVFWRNEFIIPSKFLNKLSTITFLGRKFKCPRYTEEFLTFSYGNWKKPLRTSDKKVYLSNKFYKKTSLLIIYIEKFFMKIYDYLK